MKYTQFMWGYKPEANDENNLVLYAIRGNINQKAPVDGAVESARVNYDELGRVVVDMQMDSKGSKDWKTLTAKNVNKPVAVTLDNVVYTAPNVVNEIPNGRTQISGNFSQQEAQDLVDVLGAGKLPASAKIVQADVVGPSLGKASIDAGMLSFIIAFLVIIAYIIFNQLFNQAVKITAVDIVVGSENFNHFNIQRFVAAEGRVHRVGIVAIQLAVGRTFF